jgi:phosphate transport system permease protein
MNRYTEQKIFKLLMQTCTGIVLGLLGLIIAMTIIKGGKVLISNPGIITTPPGPRYLLGGAGGFLHAILGSMIIVIPATITATILGLCTSLYLQSDYSSDRFSRVVNLFLDILWGIPSIVYGIFVLTILIITKSRASIIAATGALTLLEFPIITRYLDEALRAVSTEMKESVYSLGASRFETMKIIISSALPGISAGIIMGLARGIGDAAAVIFTAGGSIAIPTSLYDPATTLPILIFQQATSPYPGVRKDAYAASFLLITLVLGLIIISKLLAKRFSRYIPGGS